MRSIPKFNLIDTRLGTLPDDQLDELVQHGPWNQIIHGIGTDAESALDDLLHTLQERGYDVGGLESRIKEVWNPTDEEGDGAGINYHLYLLRRGVQ